MIIVKYIESENREHRYSDRRVKLRQIETGKLYEDAIDIVPCSYTYEETDIPVDEEEPTVEEKAEAYDILVGVRE